MIISNDYRKGVLDCQEKITFSIPTGVTRLVTLHNALLAVVTQVFKQSSYACRSPSFL